MWEEKTGRKTEKGIKKKLKVFLSRLLMLETWGKVEIIVSILENKEHSSKANQVIAKHIIKKV